MTTEKRPYKEVSILLVEDDDVDVMAVERALKKLKISNKIIRARDGLEALEMLRKNTFPIGAMLNPNFKEFVRLHNSNNRR